MPNPSILIASDLSARSDRAMQRGFLLAAQLGASAKVVNVVDESMPDAMSDDLVEKTRAHLEASAAKLSQGVACEVHVEKGDPVMRLVEIANGGECELVVVGRHRPRNILDSFRRTTVEHIVSQSLKPVLMTAGPVHGPYARVLAPVAFSAACHRAVATAHQLAPDAAFRVFHAWIAPFEGITGGKRSDFAKVVERETKEQATAWSQGLPEGLQDIDLVHDSVVLGLQKAIDEMKPDLMAVGANTRSVSFTGLGSFTADLLRDPQCDLLIARGLAN